MKPNVPSESNLSNCLKNAWIWLALIPVGSIAGQIVGLLISWAFGQPEQTPFVGPLWQKLLIVVPSTILIITPGFVSASYGLKVVKEGKKIGYLHVYLGGILGIGMLAISVLTFFGVGQ